MALLLVLGSPNVTRFRCTAAKYLAAFDGGGGGGDGDRVAVAAAAVEVGAVAAGTAAEFTDKEFAEVIKIENGFETHGP